MFTVLSFHFKFKISKSLVTISGYYLPGFGDEHLKKLLDKFQGTFERKFMFYSFYHSLNHKNHNMKIIIK